MLYVGLMAYGCKFGVRCIAKLNIFVQVSADTLVIMTGWDLVRWRFNRIFDLVSLGLSLA